MTENEIKQIVANGLKQEKTLNEIHKELQGEHGVKMTFMDLRLLSADIEIDWDSLEPQLEEQEEVEEAKPVLEPQENTTVEISKITRPGAAVNGSVHFASGFKGEWYLDNQGRLGLDMEDPEANPPEEEMMDFQNQLRSMLGA